LTSFEFWCFRADLRPKTKPKMLQQFRPKTKMAETTINGHFRRQKRKRKRISVGLYPKFQLFYLYSYLYWTVKEHFIKYSIYGVVTLLILVSLF